MTNAVKNPVQDSPVRVRKIQSDYGRRGNSRTLKFYIDNCEIVALLDRWFDEHDIHALKVKSKAWTKIRNAGMNIVERKVADHFRVDPKNVKWSRNCGCSCGCSPGITIKTNDWKLQRNDAWGDIDVTPAELAYINDMMCQGKIPKLLAEDLERDRLVREEQEVPVVNKPSLVFESSFGISA